MTCHHRRVYRHISLPISGGVAAQSALHNSLPTAAHPPLLLSTPAQAAHQATSYHTQSSYHRTSKAHHVCRQASKDRSGDEGDPESLGIKLPSFRAGSTTLHKLLLLWNVFARAPQDSRVCPSQAIDIFPVSWRGTLCRMARRVLSAPHTSCLPQLPFSSAAVDRCHPAQFGEIPTLPHEGLSCGVVWCGACCCRSVHAHLVVQQPYLCRVRCWCSLIQEASLLHVGGVSQTTPRTPLVWSHT